MKMQGVQKILNDMEFNTESIVQMVQQIRTHISESADPIAKAKRLIFAITDIDVKIPDVETAVPLAQFVAKASLEEEVCVFPDIIERAFSYVSELFKKHPWSAPKVASQTSGPVVSVCEGIETKVEIKADGKIKKGGKQILAVELYKKHVVETENPVDNQGFIAILMKELGMTKAGATTYAYNCKKQFAK
jgi:hypothetical protein